MVAEGVFLADDDDMMVGAVHGGTHQVRHAGVEADVVLVGLFLMDGGGDEPAVGAGDGAAQLHGDGETVEARRDDDFLIGFMDAFADIFQVDRFFLRAVGDADAAAEVDEFEADAQFFLDFHGGVEHQLRRFDEGVGVQLVGDDHAVQAEALDAALLCDAVRFDELVVGQAVFRFLRLADDVVARDEAAGVVAEGEAVGEARAFFEVVDMGDVVQVDYGAEFPRLLEFVGGGVVGSQHDFLAADARHFRQQKLGEGAAVCAGAFLGEQPQNIRVRRGLHREMLAEGRRPGERLEQPAEVLADARLVVDMERRRITPDDFFQFFLGDRKYFLWHDEPPI